MEKSKSRRPGVASLPFPDPGRRLVICVSPKPGEGLPDLLLRAASLNSYSATSTVLLAAGMNGKYPAGVATNASGHEAVIAATLGCPDRVDEIRRMVHGEVPGKPGWHVFFGAEIRLAHREILRRRVSPLALRQSPHGRAVWSVKAFSFDPATRETLLDACPECLNHLGFSESHGVCFCGRCLGPDAEGFVRGRVDLRDYPQALVEVDDPEALDFVTGLVDPDPEARATSRPRLDDSLTGHSRGALFEFAIALACAITADPAMPTAFLPRPRSREEYARFTPEVLALAGRTILQWPRSFGRLADLARERAGVRQGHFGIKKELGALLALRLDPHIESGLRDECRKAIESDMRQTSTGITMVRRKENLFRTDLITVEQASKKFAAGRKTLAQIAADHRTGTHRAGTATKAPILVSEAELSRVLEFRKDLVSAASIAKSMRMPGLAIGGLGRAGLVERHVDPLGKSPGEYVTRTSIDRLVKVISDHARPLPERTAVVHLLEAARLAGSPHLDAWPAILRAISTGAVAVYDHGEEKPFSLRYSVDAVEVARIALDALPWQTTQTNTRLTRADAAMLLCIPTPNVYGLMGEGLISENPTLAEVQAFDASYVMTLEGSRMLSRSGTHFDSRKTAQVLQAAGVQPAVTTSYMHRRVWHRTDVEAVTRRLG